jgi:hypothetical protein
MNPSAMSSAAPAISLRLNRRHFSEMRDGEVVFFDEKRVDRYHGDFVQMNFRSTTTVEPGSGLFGTDKLSVSMAFTLLFCVHVVEDRRSHEHLRERMSGDPRLVRGRVLNRLPSLIALYEALRKDTRLAESFRFAIYPNEPVEYEWTVSFSRENGLLGTVSTILEALARLGFVYFMGSCAPVFVEGLAQSGFKCVEYDGN